MASKIIWQQDSSNPENINNLALISDWWANLNEQEISFAQRLIPNSGNLDEINWEKQQFDEQFQIQKPTLRGITLYWYKANVEVEKNLTVKKLELDQFNQELYIYPIAQTQLLVRILAPKINYQTLELKEVQIAGTYVGNNCIFLLRDDEQKIEVKLQLSPDQIDKILNIISSKK